MTKKVRTQAESMRGLRTSLTIGSTIGLALWLVFLFVLPFPGIADVVGVVIGVALWTVMVFIARAIT